MRDRLKPASQEGGCPWTRCGLILVSSYDAAISVHSSSCDLDQYLSSDVRASQIRSIQQKDRRPKWAVPSNCARFLVMSHPRTQGPWTRALHPVGQRLNTKIVLQLQTIMPLEGFAG